MPRLPLNIDMQDMPTLIVGGGTVAARKIRSLVDAGAIVRVVAPEVNAEIRSLADSGAIRLQSGRYDPSDPMDAFLVVAATDSPEANRAIAADAARRHLLVVAASEPESGNCSFPALLQRGRLTISVSTDGTCPGFAAEIRDIIASVINEEYGEILETLAAEREKLLTEGRNSTYNKQILRSRIRELIHELEERKERVP